MSPPNRNRTEKMKHLQQKPTLHQRPRQFVQREPNVEPASGKLIADDYMHRFPESVQLQHLQFPVSNTRRLDTPADLSIPASLSKTDPDVRSNFNAKPSSASSQFDAITQGHSRRDLRSSFRDDKKLESKQSKCLPSVAASNNKLNPQHLRPTSVIRSTTELSSRSTQLDEKRVPERPAKENKSASKSSNRNRSLIRKRRVRKCHSISLPLHLDDVLKSGHRVNDIDSCTPDSTCL